VLAEVARSITEAHGETSAPETGLATIVDGAGPTNAGDWITR